MCADFFRREVNDLLQMLIYAAAAAVCVSVKLIQESELSGLLDIFSNGGNQPQSIICTRIVQSMDMICCLAFRNHRRTLEGLLLGFFGFRLKPSRFKEMNAISLLRQSP